MMRSRFASSVMPTISATVNRAEIVDQVGEIGLTVVEAGRAGVGANGIETGKVDWKRKRGMERVVTFN
jgi:hypothetical protein